MHYHLLCQLLINAKKSFPFEKLQGWLHLNQLLFSELNDPLGVHVACSSVTSVVIHHFYEKGNVLAAYDNSSLISSKFSH
jgi:hypothetical protein